MTKIPSTAEVQERLANLEQYCKILDVELRSKAPDSVACVVAGVVRQQASELHVLLSMARCEEGF